MLGNTLTLYKARKDPKLAKTIASEMVVDGTIDRLSGPLLFAKLWMSVGLLTFCLLIVLFLWIGAVSHWTLAIPTLAFGGIIYVILRIWRGLDRGVEKISRIAKAELGQRVQAKGFPAKQTPREKLLEN